MKISEDEGYNDFIIIEFCAKSKCEVDAIERSMRDALRGRGEVEAKDVVDGGYGAMTVTDGDQD